MSQEIEYNSITIPAKFKEVEVYGLGDFHVGNPCHSASTLKRFLDIIKDKPNAYCILNGDLAECIIPGGKIAIWGQTMTPQEQRDTLIKMLRPLKGKVLGVTRGNHEDRIYTATGMDICQDVAEAVGAYYSPDGVWVEIALTQRPPRHMETFFLYATHGYGGARTIGAKVSKAGRLASVVYADVYFVGHDHTQHYSDISFLMPDRRKHTNERGFSVGRAISHHQILVGCGAFVKWGGYSQRGQFQPTSLGTSKVTLIAGRDKAGGVDLNRKIIKVEFQHG